MTSKKNIIEEPRGFYYSPQGDDILDGDSIEVPKKTIQAAIDAAEALIPPPSQSDNATVTEAQGGIFLEDIELCESILFQGLQTTIVGSGPVVVKGSNFLSFRPQTVVALSNNAISVELIDALSFGCNFSFCGANGDNATAFDISGDCDDIFITCSSVRLQGDGGVGFNVTANSPTPIDINVNTGVMDNDNQIFFEWNQTMPSEASVINISTITSTGTGNEAIHAMAGNLNISTQLISCDSICTVEDGATLTMDANILVGNILVKDGGRLVLKSVGVLAGDLTVDSGGIVACDITVHDSGSIINNGVINGNINGEYFGNESKPISTARYVDSLATASERDGSTTNPYNSIAEALDDISDATNIKPYALRIAPGNYNEGALMLEPFISLNGYGSAEVNMTVTGINANDAGQYRIKNINIVGNVTIDLSGVGASFLLLESGLLAGNFLFTGSGAGEDTVVLNETTIGGTLNVSNSTFVAQGVNFDAAVNITATSGIPNANGDVAATRFLSCRLTGSTVAVGGTLQHSAELSNSVVDGIFTADGSNTTLTLFVDSYPNNIFFTNGAQGILKNEIDSARQGYKNDSTGLVRGGEITQGTLTTQMDIAEGVGTIFDYSDPANPEAFPVTFESFTDVDITNVATERFTWVAIDRNAAVVQFAPDDFDNVARRDNILIGAVSHSSGGFDAYSRTIITTRETHEQLMDLLDALGVVKADGLVIEPNADDTFDKTAGILVNPGAGNAQSNRAENTVNIAAESPTVFSRLLGIQDITTATGVTGVVFEDYDDGSNTPTAIPGSPNIATIQYIFQFPIDGAVLVQYGQTLYSDLEEAVSLAGADDPVIPNFIRKDALLVARIAVRSGGSDLSDAGDAIFLSGSKFGVDSTGGSGGSGAGNGDFFGPASSTIDEILTFDDATGKVGKAASDIAALAGDLQRVTSNGDLRILTNGTGAVQLGSGNILSNLGMANLIGGTVVSVATPLAGNALHQYEHNGVAIGRSGYVNFSDHLAFMDIDTSKGLFIETSGQISIGKSETDPNFSVMIGGDEKPLGLPNLTTANEGSLTPAQRMLHYNSILDRVRYYDGLAFRSVASLDDIPPLSILKYVDNNTTGTDRDGSINKPYLSSGEARTAITDNAISKQYTLVIIEDDGTSNDPKPYIYQRGVNGDNFTGGARIPNIVGRYEYSNMVVGNVNSDNLTVAAESIFTDVHFLAGSSIFTISTTTPATVKFIRCQFDGKMDFRQIDAEFVGCEINAIELIDGTLTPKTWVFRSCTLNGIMTTSGSSIGCNFTFFNCHWLPSSSLVAGYPMLVTCDNTFPHESNGQVTISSRLSESVLDDYDNSGSTLSAGNVQAAIDELDGKVGDLESVFAEAINNAQTTSIGATGVYEHINIDSALSLVTANNWDTFAGRIRFLGVSFTGIIRMTVEVHVPPGSPSPKNYDIRGALNTNVTGIFPTLFDIQAGDYRQISLEFRVSGLNNGDLIDARIKQLSGAVDQNPVISMATYEAIED